MLRKKVLGSMIIIAMLPGVVSVLPQANVSADSVKQTDIKSISNLLMIKESGFDIDWDGSTRIATFDNSSSTMVYQNGIPWPNPGGINYSKNEMNGVKQDGTKVKLTSGVKNGSSFTGEIMNYTYKLSETEKKTFVYYEVNVEYMDTLWGQKGSAQAQFLLN